MQRCLDIILLLKMTENLLTGMQSINTNKMFWHFVIWMKHCFEGWLIETMEFMETDDNSVNLKLVVAVQDGIHQVLLFETMFYISVNNFSSMSRKNSWG